MTITPFKFKHLENLYVLRDYFKKISVAHTWRGLQPSRCLRHFGNSANYSPLTARLAGLRLDTFRAEIPAFPANYLQGF